jgi:hypothetical protein
MAVRLDVLGGQPDGAGQDIGHALGRGHGQHQVAMDQADLRRFLPGTGQAGEELFEGGGHGRR